MTGGSLDALRILTSALLTALVKADESVMTEEGSTMVTIVVPIGRALAGMPVVMDEVPWTEVAVRPAVEKAERPTDCAAETKVFGEN